MRTVATLDCSYPLKHNCSHPINRHRHPKKRFLFKLKRLPASAHLLRCTRCSFFHSSTASVQCYILLRFKNKIKLNNESHLLSLNPLWLSSRLFPLPLRLVNGNVEGEPVMTLSDDLIATHGCLEVSLKA